MIRFISFSVIIVMMLGISSTCFAETKQERFFESCKYGNLHIINNMLKSGFDVNTTDSNGNTGLMLATRPENFKAVKMLVENGASINKLNSDGKTAMNFLNSMRWRSSSNQSELSRWYTYNYLKEKGGYEQDYIGYLAKNLSGKDSVTQTKILAIKQDVRSYNKNLKKHIKKSYHYENKDGDDISFTLVKEDYIARYNKDKELLFFQYKNEQIMEWHDNGTRESWDKQYYFKDGELYFYFETYSTGMSPDKSQYRLYIKNDEIVAGAYKYILGFFKVAPENMNELKELVNVKLDKSNDGDSKTLEIIEREFNQTYNDVKNKLKGR